MRRWPAVTMRLSCVPHSLLGLFIGEPSRYGYLTSPIVVFAVVSYIPTFRVYVLPWFIVFQVRFVTKRLFTDYFSVVTVRLLP